MLTIGEPDLDTPEMISHAAAAALKKGMTHYSANQGSESLRRAIAEYETARGNFTTPDRVLITVGATQALFTALMGILNPGDEVILPVPCFPLYESIITLASGVVVPLDLAATNFRLDAHALEAALSPRTKAILLNSPCNPTGTVFSQDALDKVKAVICGKPVFLIWDGVYDQLADHPCPDLSLDPDLKEQTILCQSFSKPYAMTGWRIGYLTCPAYVMEKLLLLHSATVTAVPTFVQEAAMTALRTDPAPMREIYRRRRELVCRRLREMGLWFPEPEGGFYVFPSIARFGMDSATFCTRMIREAGVAVVPGDCFGTDGYFRLSYCYGEDALTLGLDRLEEFIKTLEGAKE